MYLSPVETACPWVWFCTQHAVAVTKVHILYSRTALGYTVTEVCCVQRCTCLLCPKMYLSPVETANPWVWFCSQHAVAVTKVNILFCRTALGYTVTEVYCVQRCTCLLCPKMYLSTVFKGVPVYCVQRCTCLLCSKVYLSTVFRDVPITYRDNLSLGLVLHTACCGCH